MLRTGLRLEDTGDGDKATGVACGTIGDLKCSWFSATSIPASSPTERGLAEVLFRSRPDRATGVDVCMANRTVMNRLDIVNKRPSFHEKPRLSRSDLCIMSLPLICTGIRGTDLSEICLLLPPGTLKLALGWVRRFPRETEPRSTCW